jgi:hypothetical protein
MIPVRHKEAPTGHKAVSKANPLQRPSPWMHTPELPKRQPWHWGSTVDAGALKDVQAWVPTGHVVVLAKNGKHMAVAAWEQGPAVPGEQGEQAWGAGDGSGVPDGVGDDGRGVSMRGSIGVLEVLPVALAPLLVVVLLLVPLASLLVPLLALLLEVLGVGVARTDVWVVVPTGLAVWVAEVDRSSGGLVRAVAVLVAVGVDVVVGASDVVIVAGTEGVVGGEGVAVMTSSRFGHSTVPAGQKYRPG